MSQLPLGRAGRRRSPAICQGFHAGRPSRNKGVRYPDDLPKVEEIIAVMRAAGDGVHGRRLRGLVVILWRRSRRAVVLRRQRPEPGPTLDSRGRVGRTPAQGCRCRRAPAFAPHQLRHAHAVEMAREGVPMVVIQRQLGPSSLGITSVDVPGIDNAEIIETVNARRAPMIPVSTSLRL
jgi:Phage integrase family